MMRLTIGVALAAALTMGATADIPPPEPENPLPAACQPFIGVWARTEPQATRGGQTWTVLAIDAERATVLRYLNQDDINIQAGTMSAALTCTVAANGDVTLDFTGDSGGSFALTATPVSETSFTTKEESSYLGAGPPVEGWTPEIRTITWTRIAR